MRWPALSGVEGLERERANPSDEVLTRIVAHFVEHVEALMLPVVYTERIMREHEIAVAAWNAPLIAEMAPNLTLELLLNAGVKVLGRQHGSCYGDQDMATKHFDSDFNRCTHFFSYGMTRDEVEKTYPGMKPRCVFLPAGFSPVAPKPSAEPVDIVFPITNCIPLSSFGRMEKETVRRQRLTLHAVDARPDLKCIVKPMLAYDEDSFSQMEELKKLRHARVMRRTWTDFLRHFTPRLAVIEMISTPLYEVLHLDVDVFLMMCDIAPMSRYATEILKRRVHIFDSAEEMAAAIASYGKTPLARLRDDEFYRRYVNRGSFESAMDDVALEADSRHKDGRKAEALRYARM